jgi:hypothetical protein
MEGVGIVKASINSQRIRVAATTANKTESNHSRMADFFLTGCAVFVFVLTSDTGN